MDTRHSNPECRHYMDDASPRLVRAEHYMEDYLLFGAAAPGWVVDAVIPILDVLLVQSWVLVDLLRELMAEGALRAAVAHPLGEEGAQLGFVSVVHGTGALELTQQLAGSGPRLVLREEEKRTIGDVSERARGALRVR